MNGRLKLSLTAINTTAATKEKVSRSIKIIYGFQFRVVLEIICLFFQSLRLSLAFNMLFHQIRFPLLLRGFFFCFVLLVPKEISEAGEREGNFLSGITPKQGGSKKKRKNYHKTLFEKEMFAANSKFGGER